MKKIIYISIVALLAFCSCEKINQNLTRLPKDDFSKEAYFTTESECQLWLNRCYAQYFTSPVTTSAYWSDLTVNTNPYSIVEGTRLVTSDNDGEKAWGWQTMRRINLFLENSSNCEDEAVRLKYEALARYFRALGYYHKVQRFGDVPYFDHTVASSDKDDLKHPRDPRGFVMLKIMEDLDFAIENLSDSKDVCRVTKWTALATKSRIALFEGTWRIYHADDGFAPKNDPTEFNGEAVSLSANYFLNLCVEASKALMDSGLYSIYTKGTEPYRDLFNSADAKEDEVILAQLYNNTSSELKNMGHNLPYQFTNKNFGFTKRFVNMYLCSDGTRFTDKTGYETMWYLDEVKDRDPRLAQTIMCPGYKMVGASKTTYNDFSTTMTGYKPIKWAADEGSLLQGKGECDLAIFRYAEVLLNYAEAKAELGQLNQAELDKTVNLIRARVGMPKLLESATLDSYLAQCYPNYTRTKGGQAALLLEVRRERIIEMVLEQTHLWDLLRWCEGAQMMDNTFPKYGNEVVTGYFGIYVPGVGQYDMDGDGVVDFEIYATNPTPGITKGVKLSDLNLTDPANPLEASPAKGYVTGYRNRGFYTKWNEARDYLYPVPQPQINLVGKNAAGEDIYTQNPNW